MISFPMKRVGVSCLKTILVGCRYPINHRLDEKDKSTLMMALFFHPRRDEKIGSGAQDIKDIKVYKMM